MPARGTKGRGIVTRGARMSLLPLPDAPRDGSKHMLVMALLLPLYRWVLLWGRSWCQAVCGLDTSPWRFLSFHQFPSRSPCVARRRLIAADSKARQPANGLSLLLKTVIKLHAYFTQAAVFFADASAGPAHTACSCMRIVVNAIFLATFLLHLQPKVEKRPLLPPASPAK